MAMHYTMNTPYTCRSNGFSIETHKILFWSEWSGDDDDDNDNHDDDDYNDGSNDDDGSKISTWRSASM